MATKEDNRRCACFAKPIGILQFVDTKEKKKNTETEPILRLVLPTGGGPSNKKVKRWCFAEILNNEILTYAVSAVLKP